MRRRAIEGHASPVSTTAPNERLEFWWRQLQVVFELPDPSKFPPPPWTPSGDEQAAIDRYFELVPELFHASALSSGASMTVQIGDDGSESVQTQFPTGESLRSLAPLFRQFYSGDEKASFKRIHRIVSRQATVEKDPSTAVRHMQLKAWTTAARALRTQWLEHLVGEKVGMSWPADHRWPAPQDVISEFFYAEHLHWNPEKAKRVKAREGDPFEDGWHRMLALWAISQLSYLYVAFASLVKVAAGHSPEEP